MYRKNKLWVLLPCLFLLACLGLGTIIKLNQAPLPKAVSEVDESLFTKIDGYTSHYLLFSRTLDQLGIQLRYATGQSVQQGVLISDKGLMSSVETVDARLKARNSGSLIRLNNGLDESETLLYLTIIPTAGAVLHQNLPQFSLAVNQKNDIGNIYNQFIGRVSTIYIYNALLENKEKYIYYRTENSLTALGGYYTYSEIIRRLLSEGDIIPLNKFSVSYSTSDFYGSLYHKTPYHKVVPDKLSYYQYTGKADYTVIRSTDETTAEYHTLYPRELAGVNSYLGGSDGNITLLNGDAPEYKLLVLGDFTAGSYLPFLANHYQQIDFINIFTEADFEGISLADYDQILVVVGFENYINSDKISTAVDILLKNQED